MSNKRKRGLVPPDYTKKVSELKTHPVGVTDNSTGEDLDGAALECPHCGRTIALILFDRPGVIYRIPPSGILPGAGEMIRREVLHLPGWVKCPCGANHYISKDPLPPPLVQ
jgi:hypothetical protein